MDDEPNEQELKILESNEAGEEAEAGEQEDEEEETGSKTVYLRPGQPPGFCLQANLFYRSTIWHDLLQADVKVLLTAFVKAYTVDAAAPEQVNDGKSPFERFKALWIGQGWSKVHLFGVIEGPLRHNWTESVMRAFLEHIREDEPPIVQTAALFAVYIFYLTQPAQVEKTFISIDPPTLDYITTKFVPLCESCFRSRDADPASDSIQVDGLQEELEQSSAPHLDVAMVLHALLADSSFFIVPHEAYLFPRLPTVSIKDARQKEHYQVAKLVLGVEAEMEILQRGEVGFVEVEDGGGMRTVDLGPDAERVEGQPHHAHLEGEELGWGHGLREKEVNYLRTKELALSAAKSGGGRAQGSSTSKGKGRRVEAEDAGDALAEQIFKFAKSNALAALKDVTGALKGLDDVDIALGTTGMDMNMGTEAASLQVGGYDLLDLVGETSKKSAAGRAGLNVVEQAFAQLRNLDFKGKKRNIDQVDMNI